MIIFDFSEQTESSQICSTLEWAAERQFFWLESAATRYFIVLFHTRLNKINLFNAVMFASEVIAFTNRTRACTNFTGFLDTTELCLHVNEYAVYVDKIPRNSNNVSNDQALCHIQREVLHWNTLGSTSFLSQFTGITMLIDAFITQ